MMEEMVVAPFGAVKVDDPFGPDDQSDRDGTPPTTERWAPLGAASLPSDAPYLPTVDNANFEEFKRLEDEHEKLSSSLLSLTTHFAQVQFRLKQIVDADPHDRENLLKDLDSFASRGVADVHSLKDEQERLREAYVQQQQLQQLDSHNPNVGSHHEKQRELIQQLKSQLDDMERFAYETGCADRPPTGELLEKHSAVVEELKDKLKLDVSGFYNMSSEEIRNLVDNAIRQMIYPSLVKEKVVEQLKTQLSDLERFITFLQHENVTTAQSSTASFHGGHCSSCACNKSTKSPVSDQSNITIERQKNERMHTLTMQVMKRALSIMQMYAVTTFGCGVSEDQRDQLYAAASGRFEKNVLKKSGKANHWGDLRARLELSVEHILTISKKVCQLQLGRDKEYKKTHVVTHQPKAVGPSLVSQPVQSTPFGKTRLNADSFSSVTDPSASRMMQAYESAGSDESDSDCDDSGISATMPYDEAASLGRQMVVGVRRQLAPALRDLLRHGLAEVAPDRGRVVPWGCFSGRRRSAANAASDINEGDTDSTQLHPWDVIVRYYNQKHGSEYNSMPARTLSESFHLNVVGGRALTTKQLLLSAINSILQTHMPFKRSSDAQFKAFVCLALNQKKLTIWLRLIIRQQSLIDMFYHPWSYTAKTGFEDALKSLERLNGIEFLLPVDLSVRSLFSMNEAF